MEHTETQKAERTDGRAEQTAFAERILQAEANAVAHIPVDQTFHDSVDLILEACGAVVVTGLGKSWLIGQKISATFASTGTPSHVLHPTDAVHGDLGRVRRDDLVLALSYSGNTDEVVTLATILRQDNVPVIAIVGRRDSDLARLATQCLCVGDVTEACPMNLAPTASTTAILALGDALALAVSRRRNFGIEDFQKVHPGGALGRLLMPVTAALRLRAGKNLPTVPIGLTVREALRQAEQGRRPGAFLILDPEGKLAGIFTDADLRRHVVTKGATALDEPIDSLMAKRPRTLLATDLVRDAVQIAREFRLDEIPVVDEDDRPVGLIDVQDLIALKVIQG